MVRFLIRRLLFAALLVIAVSSGALLLTRLAPGDVTANLGAFAPAEEVARTRARFDLNRSPVAQWGGWALRASRFDFGDSFLYNRPVGELIRRAATNTWVEFDQQGFRIRALAPFKRFRGLDIPWEHPDELEDSSERIVKTSRSRNVVKLSAGNFGDLT